MLIAEPHIWIPQQRLWTPVREVLADLRRKWQGLFASSVSGDAMLDTSGNLIENSSGDAVVSDGAGAGVCTPCDPTTLSTPSSVAISGYDDDFFYNPAACYDTGPDTYDPWDGSFHYRLASGGWVAYNTTYAENLTFARGNLLSNGNNGSLQTSAVGQQTGAPLTANCDADAGTPVEPFCWRIIMANQTGPGLQGIFGQWVKFYPGVLGTYHHCTSNPGLFTCPPTIPFITLV